MQYRTRTDPNTVISCLAGRWLSIQIPAYAPGMPPTIGQPGPAQNARHELGMSARSRSSDSSWFPVDSVCRSGASVIGGMNSSVAAPTAENPNPDSPLIMPDTNRIASITTMLRVLRPATRSGLLGSTSRSVRMMATTTSTPTKADRDHRSLRYGERSTLADLADLATLA